MSNERLKRGTSRIPVSAGVTDDSNLEVTQLRVDPTTKRLKVATTTDQEQFADNDSVTAADKGNLVLGTDGSNYQILKVNSDGELITNLETADIEIGAVEIKDHDGTDRVAVNSSNELQVRDDDANTDLDTLAGAVSGSEMQVDIVADGAGLMTSSDFTTVFGSSDVVSATPALQVEEQGTVTVDATGQGDVPVTLGGEDVTSATHDNFNANATLQVGDSDVDSSNPVPTEHSITGIGGGVKTVTTAGTDEALAGSTACKRVVIQALLGNSGNIAVGASGVDATATTGTGIILESGDVFELEIDNLSDVYIDSTQNGEGVRYTYFT